MKISIRSLAFASFSILYLFFSYFFTSISVAGDFARYREVYAYASSQSLSLFSLINTVVSVQASISSIEPFYSIAVALLSKLLPFDVFSILLVGLFYFSMLRLLRCYQAYANACFFGRDLYLIPVFFTLHSFSLQFTTNRLLLSMGLFLLSFSLLFEKKYVSSVFVLGLSLMSHVSISLLLYPYVVSYRHLTPRLTLNSSGLFSRAKRRYLYFLLTLAPLFTFLIYSTNYIISKLQYYAYLVPPSAIAFGSLSLIVASLAVFWIFRYSPLPSILASFIIAFLISYPILGSVRTLIVFIFPLSVVVLCSVRTYLSYFLFFCMPCFFLMRNTLPYLSNIVDFGAGFPET